MGLILVEVIGFLSCPNPTSCTMALGLTQPLTELSTGNFPWGEGQLAPKADSLTAISEPRLSKKMWEPQCLTTVWASTACYRDSFIIIIVFILIFLVLV
jgi:hypothetical protein